MKSRRRGDLFPNASAVASCVTRRGCTRSALVRRDLSLELGKPRTKSLERNVCLFPFGFSVTISSLITDLPLREALYSDRSGSTQRSQGRPHLFKYDANCPSSPTPKHSSVTCPSRPAVASLLNPCQCNDVWNCGCRTSSASDAPYSNSEFDSETRTRFPNGNNSASAPPVPCDGLETLARAAAAVLFSSALTPQTPPIRSASASFSAADEHVSPGPFHPHSSDETATATCPSPTSTPTPVLDLPPLLFPEGPGPTPVVPPFSTFTTLAGSGCTCGLTCQCPDCTSHHPRPGVNTQDCMNCVDQSLDVIDRSGTGGFHIKSPVLEEFFAVAKRVPLPPTVGGKPVELPKLCCGGSCGCGGACGCNGNCNGCCQYAESEAPKNPSNDPISVTVVPPTESH